MEQTRRRQIIRASIGFGPAVVVELEAVSPYNDICDLITMVVVMMMMIGNC